MSGLIGKKIGMTRVFNEDGKAIVCTMVEAGPCYVSQIKTEENDGYSAVQIAYGEAKEKNTSNALQGHLKLAGLKPMRFLREFPMPETEVKLGDELTVEIFEAGDIVEVSGTTKGKGFQGVVKRHGFAGVGDQTHGQHNRLRAPGSIGAGSTPSKVVKGMKMAGRTGNAKMTIKGVEIFGIIPEKNLILFVGALPGHQNGILYIKK